MEASLDAADAASRQESKTTRLARLALKVGLGRPLIIGCRPSRAFGCLCGGLSTADALDAPASLRGPLRRQARSHVRHLRSILASSPVRVQWIAKLNAVDGRSRLRVLVELRLAGVSGHDKGRSLGPVYGTDLGTNLGANLGANLGVVGLIRPANGGETSPTPHRPAWGLRNMGMPPLQRR